MHGKDAGKPRPSRKAAMLRAYTEKALKAYKSPSSKASSSWIAAAKTQRGRGIGTHLLNQGLSGVGS